MVPAGVAGGQVPEPVLVHDGAGGGGQGGQVRAVRGGHRPDVVQPGAGQVREVVRGVLPGVEDDRHVRGPRRQPGCGAHRLVPGFQLVDHAGELGDVGPVPGIGVPGQRDPAVPGDHQAEADQPQVRAFLLGLAALRDRRPAVRRRDERREVGHVEGDGGHVHAAGLHDRHRDRAAGLLQLLRGDRVHRVPEPAVIQRRSGDLREPVRRGGLPPVREGGLGARRDQPVQRRQHQVRAGGQRLPGRARPGRCVDHGSNPEVFHDAPGCGDAPKRQVPGPLRQHGGLPGIQQRLDVSRGAHVPLGDHLGPAVHAGHLPQVPVRLPAELLRVQARHNIRSYTIPGK